MQHEIILILDFGSQYTQLIARRLRELGVKTVVERGDLGGEEIREASPIAVVLSGGPASVFEEGALQADPAVFDLGVPVLGICYGLHLMARDLGGDVRASSQREYGLAELEVVQEGSVFAGTPREQPVWMSHGDLVERMPDGFEVLATTSTTGVAAMFDPSRRFVGLQFHPEVRHTPHGTTMLEHFIALAGAKRDWNPAAIRHELVAELETKLADGKVICGVSGGVDSSVTAVLLREAIGDRVVPIFVDTGMLRKDEGDSVERSFAEFGLELDRVDASPRRSARSSGASLSRFSRPKPRDSQMHVISPREPCIRTLSSRRGCAAPRRSSKHTTTSGDCRTGSVSTWWSHCAICSRTRFAGWGRSLDCRTTSCGATHSRDLGWR